MIDSEATGNFISEIYARRNKLSTCSKKEEEGYELTVINKNLFNSKDSKVNREIIPLSVVIQHHHKEFTFDIVSMINYSVILDMPWLKEHNSEINWNSKVLKLEWCNCVITTQSMWQQQLTVDEKTKKQNKFNQQHKLLALNKNN